MTTNLSNTGWSRRGFLGLAGGLGACTLLPRLAWASGGAKRLVVVRAYGGWDVTFCMDPRLSSSSGVDGPDRTDSDEQIVNYDGLDIMASTSRPEVHSFFQQHAANTIVVNGISVGSIVHDECRQRIATGSRLDTAADMACLSAVQHGTTETLPYLDLTGGGQVGPYAAMAGSLGRNNQIKALIERETTPISAPDGTAFPRYLPSPSQQAALETYLDQRRSRFTERMGARAESARVATLQAAIERQRALEDSTLLEELEFGDSGTIQSQCTLAASLLGAGFCYSASINGGTNWDTHDDISQQHGLYDTLFGGLNVLVDALKVENIWEDTIVVVISEMTRTPLMNRDGGKDHWPNTSALLFGGGLDGGRTLGGSSQDTLDALPVNLASGELDSSSDTVITYGRFAAGVLHATGVDTSAYLPGEEVLHGIVD